MTLCQIEVSCPKAFSVQKDTSYHVGKILLVHYELYVVFSRFSNTVVHADAAAVSFPKLA